MTSRLNLALLTAAAALTLQSPAAAQNSDVTGLWRTPVDGGGLVRLTPCGGGRQQGQVQSARHAGTPCG